MSAINNAWNRTTSTATEEMIKQQYQQAIGGGGGSGGVTTSIAQSRMYHPDRWETGTATTRFTVTKASNGYILETGAEVYIADTVEQLQGIVATMLIAKAE
jgi:hypothetical protein